MKTFDVQSIGVNAPVGRVFDYVSTPENLPLWTNAFKSVNGADAVLETPQGAVEIKLATRAHREAGSIDWLMTFPDGSVGEAFSRVTPEGDGKSVFSFVLMAPPVALEALEGALEAQKAILAEELTHLKTNLETK